MGFKYWSATPASSAYSMNHVALCYFGLQTQMRYIYCCVFVLMHADMSARLLGSEWALALLLPPEE